MHEQSYGGLIAGGWRDMPIELRDVPLVKCFTTVFSAASPAAGINAKMMAAAAMAPSPFDGRLPRQLPGMATKSDAKLGNPRAECGALAFWELSLGIDSAAAFTMSYVGNPSGAMGSLSRSLMRSAARRPMPLLPPLAAKTQIAPLLSTDARIAAEFGPRRDARSCHSFKPWRK